jgi:multidrug transporter EmrE-like cation transporter
MSKFWVPLCPTIYLLIQVDISEKTSSPAVIGRATKKRPLSLAYQFLENFATLLLVIFNKIFWEQNVHAI